MQKASLVNEKRFLVFLLIGIIIMFGCNAHNISISIRKASDFQITDMVKKKCGILPAFSIASAKYARINANSHFQQFLIDHKTKKETKTLKQIKLDSSKRLMLAITDKNLLDKFVKIQKNYTAVRIMDISKISMIGKQLGYDYLLCLVIKDEKVSKLSKNSFDGFAYVTLRIIDVNRSKTVLKAAANDSIHRYDQNDAQYDVYKGVFLSIIKRIFP